MFSFNLQGPGVKIYAFHLMCFCELYLIKKNLIS